MPDKDICVRYRFLKYNFPLKHLHVFELLMPLLPPAVSARWEHSLGAFLLCLVREGVWVMLVYTGSVTVTVTRKCSFVLISAVSEVVVSSACDLIMMAITCKNANHRLWYRCAATTQALWSVSISLLLQVNYNESGERAVTFILTLIFVFSVQYFV